MRYLLLFLVLSSACADPLPVGTVSTPYGTVSGCPSGFTCKYVNVTSPALPCYAVAQLAIAEPSNAVATDLLFSGSSGGGWWTNGLYSGSTFVQDLLNANHRIVQILWDYTGWCQKRDCPNTVYPIQGSARPAAHARTETLNRPDLEGLRSPEGPAVPACFCFPFDQNFKRRMIFLQVVAT